MWASIWIALSGLIIRNVAIPRALPWAEMNRPFGAAKLRSD
jgi:hypothetical protein